MTEKQQQQFNLKENNDERLQEQNDVKLEKQSHIYEMLGYPSLIDKIRNKFEDLNDGFQVRPRRQSNDELQSPERKNDHIQSSKFQNDVQDMDQNYGRNRQITQLHRKKGGSYDNKNQKGGVLSRYKHLESKFILDLNSRDDLHQLYESINLEKKTEMILLMLKRSLGQLELFRDLEQNLKQTNYINLLRSLKTLIVRQGSTIFSYGSVGKQYFFLVKGSVYILLRTGLGSKINNLEKVNPADQQLEEQEKLKKERKKLIQQMKKRDSLNYIGQPQNKNKKSLLSKKIDSQVSIDFDENEQYKQGSQVMIQDLQLQMKQIQDHQIPQKSKFLSKAEISSPTNGLSQLLKIQQTEKREEDLRSQRSAEDRISIAWSVDSVRNKEEIKKQFPHFQIVGTHNQGEGFGELSLLKGIKRTATIVAKEDCFFLTLDKESYLNCLAEHHEKIYQEKISFVKQYFIFEQLDKRLPSLIILFEPKTFISGQYIYQPGEETNYLYLIKKGTVSINRKIIKRTEKELIKKVEEQDNVASQYIKQLQSQQKNSPNKQTKNKVQFEFDSENTSKHDNLHDSNNINLDPQWDKKLESEENDENQEDISELLYSEEKGAFVGRNQSILSMMRNSPTKDRYLKASNSSSLSPKKKTVLTVVGENGFFGEEEIVNHEKFREYEAQVTSSKVEVLRISLKNLKIVSKYNDVMQRIKAYSELKNEWRHTYVERSQNALLIQNYLAKNFKELYTKNILNKQEQQKAAVQIMSKTVPDSMNANKQAQSILNRKLYIKKGNKINKEKQIQYTKNDAIEEKEKEDESSEIQRKQSQDLMKFNSFTSSHRKSSDHRNYSELNYNRQNNNSSLSPNLIKKVSSSYIQSHQINPTMDISCNDSNIQINQSLKIIESTLNKSQNKLQKEYNQKNIDSRQKNSQTNIIITKTHQYQKSTTDSPVIQSLNQSQKNQIRYQQSLITPFDDNTEQSNKNSTNIIKIMKVQKENNNNNNNSLVDTLTTNQNENSLEDLMVFQTQQKYFSEKRYHHKQKSGQICNYLQEMQSDEKDNQDSTQKNNNNNDINLDNQQIQNNISPIKNNYIENSPKVKQIIEKQAYKMAQESELKKKRADEQIKKYQKEQIDQMEKLREIMMKEKQSQTNSNKKPQQKSKEDNINNNTNSINNSTNHNDLNFREIHSIFINIEGIKSTKLNKYTKQYKEVKEKYEKNPKKKHSYIPDFEKAKASEIVFKSKLRSSSNYVNESIHNSNQKSQDQQHNSSYSKKRSNSIISNPIQPQRKFSFKSYIEKQKHIENNNNNSLYHPIISQFKTDSVHFNNNQNTNTYDNKHTDSSSINNNNNNNDKASIRVLLINQNNNDNNTTNHEIIPSQTTSSKNNLNNTKQQHHNNNSNNNSSNKYEQNILDQQNYYFQIKSPQRKISINQNKSLNKILEKENSMLLNQEEDYQDHQSEILIDEQNAIDESDIDQVRNMLLLVKKLKIDHIIESKHSDISSQSGFMNHSINIISAPTTARSLSQNYRRKRIPSISDKKPINQGYNHQFTQEKNHNQEINEMNNTCINFKDESYGKQQSSSRQIFDITQREETKRRKSSGAIFRPTVPQQSYPIKTTSTSNNNNNKDQHQFSLHSKYPNFHHH